MKIGVIGTSSIVSYFCECVHLFEELTLEAVYSRSLEKGQGFAVANQVNQAFDDFKTFLEQVDIVYVASPNTIHYNQAKEAIMHKKHVIVEKPMTTKVSDSHELYNLAQENNVFIMEAITTLANPLLVNIKKNLVGEEIQHIDFKMMQQSSRYPKLVNNIMTNAFDKNMGGGAGYDLGVYLNTVLLYLVGLPKKTTKIGYDIEGYADTTTTYIHQYNNFVATLTASKVAFSNNYNEIITKNKTIKFNSVGDLTHVLIYSPQGELIEEINNIPKNRMFFELKHFLDIIASKQYVSDIYSKQLSLDVLSIIEN